jgi:hypothetical protein
MLVEKKRMKKLRNVGSQCEKFLTFVPSRKGIFSTTQQPRKKDAQTLNEHGSDALSAF